MITRERLSELLANVRSVKIGLVGDLFLDRYLEIDATLTEVSIETGLDAYQVTRVRNSPGALGTVLNNLLALGVRQVHPVSVIGDDGHGYDLQRELQDDRIDAQGILAATGRLTPTYTKPMFQEATVPARELNRLDVRSREPLADKEQKSLLYELDRMMTRVDAVIVLDQVEDLECGVIGTVVRQRLRELSQQLPQLAIVIDSRNSLAHFDFGILKGNHLEFCQAAETENEQQAACTLAARTQQPVVCTRGEDGVLVTMPAGETHSVNGIPVGGALDIVGAGDSVTSALAAIQAAGGSIQEAAEVANLVASITVQQVGTTGVATPTQVLARFDQIQHGTKLTAVS